MILLRVRDVAMKWMSSNEIRTSFLNYFKNNNHVIVPSSSLVPVNDPTLLFTNAGMVQFKEVFLGLDKRSYTRATSVQRCVRAGGKHNDLENVGYTRRHHTLFEMLGNFSFGDYFKREAIQFAWNYLTEILKIDPQKLWVSVFRDDPESEKIWLNEIKVDPNRFSRCGEDDNFWAMGELGPCGPCTEIFYDHGPQLEGGPPGSPNQDGDRYVEVWNLVFMQYDRDIQGTLSPLPKPCVDTGMGLERIAAVMQGVHDNYEIDTFHALLTALSKIINYNHFSDKSMRVIVDHIRSTTFLIADGVTPSNEGRGYVLRRVIRRAVRHGFKLGEENPFFYKLVAPLIKEMGDAYPELKPAQHFAEQIIKQEEIQFSNTLERGLNRLDQEIAGIKNKEIPGQLVFQLYDTFGFPPDLTADIARERGLVIDYIGFEQAMAKQREQSQGASQFYFEQLQQLHIPGKTKFTGYEKMVDDGEITTLLHDNNFVSKLSAGQKGIVVLNTTPFYAESGGQIGDTGYLYGGMGEFRVTDTQKKGQVYLHIGEMTKGDLHIQEKVKATVDEVRKDIVLNHSATHLLHEALRRVLGSHVIQKGSLVEAKRLRFDFSHPKPLTKDEIIHVEQLVNKQIRANLPSIVKETSLDEAKKQGALALFGEKYEGQVRMIKMGEFSTELCGGTHAESSGDIGIFKIIYEGASSSGIRRIEAVTGREALSWIEKMDNQLDELSELLKTSRDNLSAKLSQLLDQNKSISKEMAQLKQALANQQSLDLLSQAEEINHIHVLAVKVPFVDRDALRNMLDQMKQKLGCAAIVLATVQDDNIQLVAGVSKDCLAFFNATELLNQVAHQVGGKGGGRPDLAQGGGNQPQQLDAALKSVAEWVRVRVKVAEV